MTLSTYLNFDGNCQEAFDFYRSVFGGDFAIFQTFRNMPSNDMGVAEDQLDKVMHVSFPIGDSVLMGSDAPSGFGPPHNAGNNFSLSMNTGSREESDSLMAKLSEGGQVTMPLADMFWGAYFGACTDRFGINWQINCEQSQE